jgi:putative DNA-invertase from lambdoid prophage Rac
MVGVRVPGPTVALLYRRVSTLEQARDGLSLGAQLAETRTHAARRGWVIGTEFVDVLSGVRNDRPQYTAMLRELRRLASAGHSVAVVVARLDRLGRSVLERARCAEELLALGATIHSSGEGGRLPQLVYDLLAAVAEDEVQRLSERLRETRQFVVDSGWHHPTRPAWGYLRCPATPEERAQDAPHIVLDVDPVRAPHIQAVFARAERGDSLSSITAWVHRLSPGERGQRKLCYQNVRQLLKRPVYVARPVRGSPRILDRPVMRWPPLITDQQWERVQARFDGQKYPARPRKHLLAGLIWCGRCSARLGGTRNQSQLKRTRGWKIQPRYVCTGRATGAGDLSLSCYESAMMPAVDAQVLARVMTLLHRASGEEDGQPQSSPSCQLTTADASVNRTVCSELPEALRSRLTQAAMRLVDGQLSPVAYRRARDRVLEKASPGRPKGDDSRQLRTPLKAHDEWPEPSVIRAAWNQAKEASDVSQQRQVLAQLIERVVPIRRSPGSFDVSIVWTELARTVFHAVDDANDSDLEGDLK